MGLTEDWEAGLGDLGIHSVINHEGGELYSELGLAAATDVNFTKLLKELDEVLHFTRKMCEAVDGLVEKVADLTH